MSLFVNESFDRQQSKCNSPTHIQPKYLALRTLWDLLPASTVIKMIHPSMPTRYITARGNLRNEIVSNTGDARGRPTCTHPLFWKRSEKDETIIVHTRATAYGGTVKSCACKYKVLQHAAHPSRIAFVSYLGCSIAKVANNGR
jgi:hypothetical protein